MKVAGRKEFIKSIVLPGVIILLVVCMLIFIICAISRKRLRDSRRVADYELAGLIHEEYPDIDGYDIVRILKYRDSGNKSGTDYYEQGKDVLADYGYDIDYTAPEIQRVTGNACMLSILVIVLGIAVYSVIIFLYQRKKSKEIAEVTGYIHNLNDKKYDLMMADNSEDELSLLRNEVYKTTVILKEIAENKTIETKRLSESLADISHQLRTPLTSMTLMIDNICDDPDMPEDVRSEFLNDIRSEVTWMISLVNSLLVLAKFDAGTIVMKDEEIDAWGLLHEAVKRLGVLLEVHGVSIVWEGEKQVSESGDETIEDQRIVFNGDMKWQLEAVSNIIKNCAEHSKPGGKIYLSVEQNSIYTKLTVRDEGEGMTSEDMRHVFERFYKAQNAKADSIGIGLSLAKSIVETGRGYITVDSVVGEGTTFQIKYQR